MSNTLKLRPDQGAKQVSDAKLAKLGRAVIEIETQAIAALGSRVNGDFIAACRLMLACQARIVVLGMGKSGHIGSKVAATLASTGTPAFFVHPGEASHGDMGMLTRQDVVLALSNSGETREIIVLLPLIKRLGVPLIALTGKPDSTLAKTATVNIDVSVAEEACPLGLAPTASTTAALAMSDALAVALLEARGFSAEDFARSHPGGNLGRKLLLMLVDIMHTGEEMPIVGPDDLLSDALIEMSRKGLGMTAIVDKQSGVAGIFTDGDLRRTLDKGLDVHTTSIADVMTRDFLTISEDRLAAEALNLMQNKRINGLLVVAPDNTLVGILNMHDLLQAGVF